MKRELESLVRKLDRKEAVDWVDEMRLGKPAYDHLMACVRGAALTRHQRANALRAFFRLRSWGSEEAFFGVLREHASHNQVRVRSEAVKLLIGMMRLHGMREPFDLPACTNEIDAGMALGLYGDVAAYAKDFLEGRIMGR